MRLANLVGILLAVFLLIRPGVLPTRPAHSAADPRRRPQFLAAGSAAVGKLFTPTRPGLHQPEYHSKLGLRWHCPEYCDQRAGVPPAKRF